MFTITRSTLNEMVGHAQDVAPIECCGLLSGRDSLMDELLPCTNEQCSPTSFSIPPVELLDRFQDLRRRRRQLLGIYHSHPTGPERPSRRDVDEFEYPEVSYWIVSLQGGTPVIRCFHWTGKGFDEATFQAVEPGDRIGERAYEMERGGLP